MVGSSNGSAPNWWESPATEPVLYATATRLVAMLELCACRFEPFPFEVQLPRIEPGRIVIPVEEPGIAAWSGQAGVELPVHLSGFTVGRFVLVPARTTVGVGFSPADRAEAIAMAEELGPVIAAAMRAEPPTITTAASAEASPRPNQQ